jgi:glycosyltransferase involved in cell wall biosynthesis
LPPKPKNILYLSSFGNLRWGGQKSLFHLVTCLDRNKFHPVVLLPSDEDFTEALRLRQIDVIIEELPPIGFFSIFKTILAFRNMLKIINHYDIDLIHTDGPRNTFYAGFAAKLKNLPLVWHIRSSDKDRYDALLVPLCTKIILVANALRNRFSGTRNDKKFTTIYNGVDLSEFDESTSPPPNIRSEYHMEANEILIGSFARIETMKGQRHLIEASAQLKNTCPFKLFLYGEILDQSYYQACAETVQKLGLQEYVVFGGHQKDVFSIMKKMDFVVLNSFGEAFPRSVIEAMAAAKPMIVTDVGGSAEAVEEGVSGFVVTPGDTEMLANRMIKLGKDKGLRLKFGEAARRQVEELFTIEENVRKTEQIYQALLGDKIT